MNTGCMGRGAWGMEHGAWGMELGAWGEEHGAWWNQQPDFCYLYSKLKFRKMSNLRRLKKDIDYLIFEVIADCFTFKEMHPGEKEKEITSVISDAVSLRNDLFKRANNPEQSEDPKVVRAYFKLIVKDLFTGADKLCSRLSLLSKKKGE